MSAPAHMALVYVSPFKWMNYILKNKINEFCGCEDVKIVGLILVKETFMADVPL